jgi:hypothetical protein
MEKYTPEEKMMPPRNIEDKRPDEPVSVEWNKETATEEEGAKTKERIAEIKKELGAPDRIAVDTRQEEPVKPEWNNEVVSEKETAEIKENLADMKDFETAMTAPKKEKGGRIRRFFSSIFGK